MSPSTQANILDICAQLEAKGLTISSGLVKAKLSEKVALPKILAGIAAYKSGVRAKEQDLNKMPNSSEVKPSQTLSELVQHQQTQIEALQKDIKKLQAQISELQENTR